MCRNHSHLIAELSHEATDGELPVLTYVLKKTPVSVESPAGSVLILPTSGRLYVPSLALGGFAALLPHRTEAPSMSLYYMPDAARIGILHTVTKWMNSLLLSAQNARYTEGSQSDDDVVWNVDEVPAGWPM